MGQAASKASRRTLPKLRREAAADEVLADAHKPGIGLEQEDILPSQSTRKDQTSASDVKDEGLGALLKDLSGSISGRRIPTSDHMLTRPKKTSQEKEADLRGRVSLKVLRCILTEHAQHNEGFVQMLARKHGVDVVMLENVLRYHKLVKVEDTVKDD